MSQQIRTPEGYQAMGAQAAFTANGAIQPGATYVSITSGALVTLPSAEAIGGGILIIENLDGAAAGGIEAAAGESIDGTPSIILGAGDRTLIVRTGPTAVRSFGLA